MEFRYEWHFNSSMMRADYENATTEKFLIDCRQEPPVVVARYASTSTPESIAKDVAKLLTS